MYADHPKQVEFSPGSPVYRTLLNLPMHPGVWPKFTVKIGTEVYIFVIIRPTRAHGRARAQFVEKREV